MPTVAYISNADSHDIVAVMLDHETGAAQVIQRVDVGGTVMPLALGPDKRSLHAAIRSEPFNVQSFAIDADTGLLQRTGTAPLPDSMAYATVDRTGRWLVAASYPGHLISVSAIENGAVVREPSAVIATGKNAHAAVIDASNRFVFVTNLGSDQVLQFRFDAATGRLTPNDPPAFKTRAGAGPRHLVLHPNARHAYLLHELDATVDLLAFDDLRGTLTLMDTWPTMPPGTAAKPWAADLHLTANGKFLYTCERNTSTIAIWKVDATSGELTLVGQQPTEQQPRGFNIDPTGTWLLAVGQASGQLTVYRIDRATGLLEATTRLAVGRNPNWVTEPLPISMPPAPARSAA